MMQPEISDGIIRGYDAKGRPIADLQRVHRDTTVHPPADPDADPTAFREWEAMVTRPEMHISGGHGGGSRGRHTPMKPISMVCAAHVPEAESSIVRFCTRVTIGEREYYHQHPGADLEALRAEVGRIVEDGHITLPEQQKKSKVRKVNIEVQGLDERCVAVLRASRSAAAVLSAYARRHAGDRIRLRERGKGD
jgi:hypothetical protein